MTKTKNVYVKQPRSSAFSVPQRLARWVHVIIKNLLAQLVNGFLGGGDVDRDGMGLNIVRFLHLRNVGGFQSLQQAIH